MKAISCTVRILLQKLVTVFMQRAKIRLLFWGRSQVYDLPQLYTKPSAEIILKTLDLLSIGPVSFSGSTEGRPIVSDQGLPRYLTTIISSSLSWIASDEQRDLIYASASARLAERSGRSALPSLTRLFEVTPGLSVTLHEPSLTGDNLGLKTWTSSLLLAKRLQELSRHLPSPDGPCVRALELGAGTGLAGIAAACIWKADVTLTDLPQIVGNLGRNVGANSDMVEKAGGRVQTAILDWSDPTSTPKSDGERFPVIFAADPLYSPEHPRLLVDTVLRWLRWEWHSCLILELPLREGYDVERRELKRRLQDCGFILRDEGEDRGFDDWQGREGQLQEVRCSWSVWQPDISRLYTISANAKK